MLRTIITMTICGSLLTILLLILKPITKKFFSPNWQYYIWITVLIVMIMPISIKYPIKTAIIEDIEANEIKPIQAEAVPTQLIEYEQSDIINGYEKIQIILPEIQSPKTINRVTYIWLIGVISFFILKIIKYFIFLSTIYKNSELSCLPEIEMTKISVRTTDMIGAPLLIGLFKPILLLPQTSLTAENLKYILLHEMKHFHRHDILYKWFALIVNSVHWFNPFIYLVLKQIDEECEISCDTSVTSNMNIEDQNGYMNTILTLLASKNVKPKLLTTQMANTKKVLKRRFEMIRNAKKKSKIITVISIVIAVFLFSTAAIASGILNNNKNNTDELKPSTSNISNVDSHLNSYVDNDNGDSRFNVLLNCTDDYNGIDALMVISVDKINKCVSTLSIPRATLIEKENRNYKISSLFLNGYTQQDLADIVSDKFGIPINYYVGLNFKSFRNFIDTLGGVEYDVPTDLHYSDPYQNLNISLDKGLQILDGEKAEHLLRFRAGYTRGDMARIEVQLSFLKSLVNQKLNFENILKLSKAVNEFSNDIVTNYPINNIIEDSKFIKNMSLNDFKTFILPGENEIREQMLYYIVDNNKLQDMVSQYFLIKETDIASK